MTPAQARAAAAARERYARLRETVFGHYGTACACCGTDQNLAIDHVNGDGGQHRAELFGGNGMIWNSREMYLWLVRNGFPPGFQAMCRRCNTSKGTGPRCRIDHELAALAAAGRAAS